LPVDELGLPFENAEVHDIQIAGRSCKLIQILGRGETHIVDTVRVDAQLSESRRSLYLWDAIDINKDLHFLRVLVRYETYRDVDPWIEVAPIEILYEIFITHSIAYPKIDRLVI
jgi:hypothetical protein